MTVKSHRVFLCFKIDEPRFLGARLKNKIIFKFHRFMISPTYI